MTSCLTCPSTLLIPLLVYPLVLDHYRFASYSFSLDLHAPAVPKERPWIVLRRFGKRGGKKVQIPDTLRTVSSLDLSHSLFV